MPVMKGSAFTARFAYLRKTFPARWEELVASFDDETRALAIGPCLKGSWYDFARFVDLNLKSERLLGDGKLSLVRDMGRNAAVVNLPVLYRLFYKVGSPEYVLSKAASLWRQHHDTGRAEMRMIGPHAAEYALHEFATPHPTLCRSLEGFILGSLETMNMREVKIVEIRCRLRGQEACVYQGTWLPR